MKKLNPVFLDRAQYMAMCDNIENLHKNNLPMPEVTLHGIPTKITPIRKKNDFCFISYEDKRIVIQFQGSNDFFDWLSNARFLQGFHSGVHGGFYHSAVEFVEEVNHHICEALTAGKMIVIGGHSRGGALARFMAVFAYRRFETHLKVMTFGSPPCFGSEWRDEYNEMNIHDDNVQNSRDIVRKLGKPLFKRVGHLKVLPIPFLWNFNFVKRHKGYYENIKRLS